MNAMPTNYDPLHTWLAGATTDLSVARHLIVLRHPYGADISPAEAIVLQPVVEKWKSRFSRGL